MEAHTQAGAAHAAQPARKKKNRKDRNRNKFKQEQEQPAGAAARPAAKPRPLPVVSEGVAKPASKKHKRQKRLGAAEAPQLGDGPSTSSRPAEPAQPPRSLTMQGGSKKGKAGGAGKSECSSLGLLLASLSCSTSCDRGVGASIVQPARPSRRRRQPAGPHAAAAAGRPLPLAQREAVYV